MYNLNLFIDSHYKYIVSIIRVKHILTLHLSTANWRILPTTGCCCKNTAARYVILPGRVNTTVPWVVAYFNAPWVKSNFTLLYRNATSYGITNVNIDLKWLWSPIKTQKWEWNERSRKLGTHGTVQPVDKVLIRYMHACAQCNSCKVDKKVLYIKFYIWCTQLTSNELRWSPP